MKVLIIDDEVDICYLLTAILTQENLKSNSVYRIADAKLAVIRDHPEIIFLDNHLPDGLGVDLIEFINKNSPSSKIVVITAHDSPEDQNTAYKKGADIFLGKPFTKDAIKSIVNRLSIA